MALAINRTLRLPQSQYFPGNNVKSGIALHHTVGGTVASTFDYWKTNKDMVGTAYIIERDGTVFEVFEPTAWAWQFGLSWPNTQRISFEKRFIGIEIASEGGLKSSGGKLYSFDRVSEKTEKKADTVFDYGKDFRGFRHFDRYEPEQVASVIALVNELCTQFNIEKNVPGKFFEFYGDRLKNFKGIIGHTMVRQDKSDPIPDISFWNRVVGECGLKITDPMELPTAVPAAAAANKLDKDSLFNENMATLNQLEIGAGSLVKGLVMELGRGQNTTYIKLRNPKPKGFEIFYDVVQGDKGLVPRLARALGFKDVSENRLEVFSA